VEIDESVLFEMYHERKMTLKEISHFFGFKSTETIRKRMEKLGIKRRNFIEAQRNKIPDITEITELYVNQELSMREIEKITGFASETIRRFLIKNGIGRRPKTHNFAGHNKGNPMPITQKTHLSENRKERYRSGKIVHWNLGRKTPYETRKKTSETLLGGRTPAPSNYGPGWKMNRTARLQYDEFMCQQCCASDNLEVHHWEPFRFSFDNSIDNLVTLCRSCHLEMHEKYRREGWIAEMERNFYGNV
jgi:hypothetical protein